MEVKESYIQLEERIQNKEKIKIALFTDVLAENVDGVTNTLYNLIGKVPKSKFEFIFITPHPPVNREEFPFRVVEAPYISFILNKNYRLALPMLNKHLKEILDKYQPDIIHFTTPSFLGLYAVNYAKVNNIPLVSTYHTHFASYVEYYFRFFPGLKSLIKSIAWKITVWFYNQCDTTFVPTQPIIDEMIDAGIESKRLVVWGRGVDTHHFTPLKRNVDYLDRYTEQKTKRILFVSRLVMEKELKTLVGIYKSFEKMNYKVSFIVTGDGPKKAYLERKMPNAIFTGKMTGDELSRIYASCDIFLFPSITETFGNVVLEAMASGLPVVVAGQGGPKGIVEHNKTGLHAEAKNIDDFCEKIRFLLDNPETTKLIGMNARIYSSNQDWSTICSAMFEYYEDIIGKNREEFLEYSA